MYLSIQFWISIGFAMMGMLLCLSGIFMHVFLYGKNKNISHLLLGIGVAPLIWHVLIYSMIYTREIQYYPQMYNKGIPFYYLVAPCFYFYVRLKIDPARPIGKYWMVHIIPFCLGMIDIVPYALASSEEKNKLLQLLVKDIPTGFKHRYGYVDQQFHYILRFLLAVFYVIGQWRILYLAEGIGNKLKNRVLLFNVIYTTYLLLQCSMVVAIVFNNQQEAYILKSLDKLIWVSFSFLLFSVWFFADAVNKVRSAWRHNL
ncbi:MULTISPECIES: hypothetical protein [Sphingobacterium]|uniref:hypothetical protein n=1 Tax=Sphingobacterium TaxID=28453 RepID=UPI00257C2171|nr:MULTISPECIES: hypothetical protein [Sphingobacterium]